VCDVVTERICIVITLQTRLPEVLGSNIGRDASHN
jgi:hypothetical protein